MRPPLQRPQPLFATTHNDVRGKERRGAAIFRMGKTAYLDLFLLGTAGAPAPSSQEPGTKQASKTGFSRLKPPAKVFLFRMGRQCDSLVLSGVGAQHSHWSPSTGAGKSFSIPRQTHTKLLCCTEASARFSLHVSSVPAQTKVEAAV